MKKRFLQFGMTAKAVMIALLLGAAGFSEMFAQVIIGDLRYYLYNYSFGPYASIAGHKDGTSAIGTLTIPETVIYEGVTYPVTEIGRNAFSGCNLLSGDLSIPNSITSIGTCAFQNCNGINGSLTIGNSVTYMGGEVFKNCFFDEIYYNAINCSDFWYPSYPFESCGGGTLIIGNGVERIPSFVFYNAYFTNNPNIPNSVKSIGQGAFDRTMWYFNQPNGLLYLDGWCLGYKGDKPTGNLTIQEGTRGIADNAFWLCEGLISVDMPNTVLYIGNEAFCECSGLETVNLSSSLKSFGIETFWYCSNLTSIIIPNSVTIINENTFGYCSSLSSVTIPSSVTTIKDGAFLFCTSLSSIEIPNSVTTIESLAFEGCSGLTSIVIPNSVVFLGEFAFANCINLTSIVIPNSVVFLGQRAFAYCTNLTYAYIGNSVSNIEGRLFEGCTNLVQIVVDPDNTSYDSRENCNAIIKTANNRLVDGCNSTIIPNSVTSIGNSAFSDCNGLASIVIPNSVTIIYSEAFARCRALNTIRFSNTITEIGETAFVECSGLTTINIPNSVTTIGGSAFAWCSNLTSVTIGNSVTILGGQLFDNCMSLVSVTLLSIEPPTLENLLDMDDSNYPIYVPYESLDEYKTATNWSNYEDRIFPIAYKSIPAHGQSDGWQFIASPLAENTAPTEIDDMLPTTGTYDLYLFDQTENAEWRNYKANNFNLVNGQGYLYANAEDVNLIFKGTFNEDETKNVGLVYDANVSFAGWNLVGNPFPVSAYANKSFYTMNEDGSAIEPVAVSMETAIPACTGVMVKAENTGESVTFSKTAPETQGQNNGTLQIAVAQANTRGASTSSATILDKAIVSFNEGDELGKFVFNKDNAKLYIPQGNEEYAIAYAAKQGEMPLNFEASETGEYTICIKAENAEFDYLHLIDNLTGADIDLLPLGKGGKEDFQPATYTFTAKTTDYASRFRLVFSVSGDADGDDDTPFAFVNNGEIVITTSVSDATLQIVDVMGRVVYQGNVMNRVSTDEMTKGVYVIRLIKGDDVKTQKMVIE